MTDQQIQALIDVINNETGIGANTKERVAQVLGAINQAKTNNEAFDLTVAQVAGLESALTALNNTLVAFINETNDKLRPLAPENLVIARNDNISATNNTLREFDFSTVINNPRGELIRGTGQCFFNPQRAGIYDIRANFQVRQFQATNHTFRLERQLGTNPNSYEVISEKSFPINDFANQQSLPFTLSALVPLAAFQRMRIRVSSSQPNDILGGAELYITRIK